MVKVSRSQAAELREAILTTTAHEFRRVGYEPTALMSVADRCGVTSSAVYNRFGGKAELAKTILVEQLEPVIGPPLDQRAADPWRGRLPTGVMARASTPDPDLMAVLHELQLAAAHEPELREPLLAFGTRRLDAGLEARGAADRRGRVRRGQDPVAQVLVHAAAAPGTYVLGLTGTPPSTGWRSVGHLLRLATRDMPLGSPAPAEPIRPGGSTTRDPSAVTSSPATAAAPPRVHDQLGRALIAAGARVIADQGYDRATVAAIARRAGVTTGALYNRFEGKYDLLCEAVETLAAPCVDAEIAALLDALDDGSASSDAGAASAVIESIDPSQEPGRLRALVVQARHTARREPGVAGAVGRLQHGWVAELAGGLSERQGAGSVRPDIDPAALAWWWLALPTGLAMLDGAATGPVDWQPTMAAVLVALRAPLDR
jgi:AcrR family transcriptional regulator